MKKREVSEIPGKVEESLERSEGRKAVSGLLKKGEW
jgi:hypothetical protein